MDNELVAAAFNAWLEDYIEHPDKFRSIEEDVSEAIRQASKGETPDYGTRCSALLARYMETVAE